jgi:hypothetical protein
MIENDEQLAMAQKAVLDLQQIVLSARRVHSQAEYRSMSEPILLEIQQREQEILEYLTSTNIQASLA